LTYRATSPNGLGGDASPTAPIFCHRSCWVQSNALVRPVKKQGAPREHSPSLLCGQRGFVGG